MTDIIIETVPEPAFMDLCLRFADEVQAFNMLNIPQTETMPVYSEDGTLSTITVVVEDEYVLRYAVIVDQIGTIYKPTGVILQEDIPEMLPLDGYHVNLRGVFLPEEVNALQEFVVLPKAPVRVWA